MLLGALGASLLVDLLTKNLSNRVLKGQEKEQMYLKNFDFTPINKL